MKRHAHWMIWLLAFTAATAMAANFSKQNVGSPGGWTGTIAGTYLNGTLYTVESSGSLYATDPANGAWTRLGNPDFANTAFLFGVGGSLVSIETDGTLYLIQPRDGSWKQSGPSGGWANTVAGAALGTTLYTIEKSGALYATTRRRAPGGRSGGLILPAQRISLPRGASWFPLKRAATCILSIPRTGRGNAPAISRLGNPRPLA